MNAKCSALAGAAFLALCALGAAAPAQAGLVINPIYSNAFTCPNCGIDPATVVSLNGNAAAQAAVNAAVHQVANNFGNNVSANILFYGVHAGADGFLAGSISAQTVYTYDTFKTALGAAAAAHPTNAVLNSAFDHLGSGNGANDPNALLAINTAHARVLGLGDGVVPVAPGFSQTNETGQFDITGNFVPKNGLADGMVFINLDQSFSFTRPVPGFSDPPGPLYDARTSVEHEVDEIMGIGGSGSQLNDFHADPNYAFDFYGVNGHLFGDMDLFRYAAPGTPSFDPTSVIITGCKSKKCVTNGVSPYFSVDGGVTSIDTFNQAFPLIGGDAADWGLDLSKLCPGGGGFGGTGDVQDAFSCNNHSADVRPGTASFLAYEAVGYNAVPEPGVWGLLISGFGLAGSVLRRTRRAFVAA